MSRLYLAAALACLFALPAFGQSGEDAPIPYDDDGASEERELPKRSKKSHRLREEDEEALEREESLAWVDDPNIGLSLEGLSGAMLFESSRGALVDPRFMWGFRFTWEFGRLFPDEALKEMFFADVTWQYAATNDGTTQVRTDSNQHYFTLAPAIAFPLGPRSFMSFYAQAGVGVNVNYAAVHLDKVETNLTGSKFLVQYGVGLRGRPAVTEDGSVRISFRVELTRFLRGYMHDTYLGAGFGVTF